MKKIICECDICGIKREYDGNVADICIGYSYVETFLFGEIHICNTCHRIITEYKDSLCHKEIKSKLMGVFTDFCNEFNNVSHEMIAPALYEKIWIRLSKEHIDIEAEKEVISDNLNELIQSPADIDYNCASIVVHFEDTKENTFIGWVHKNNKNIRKLKDMYGSNNIKLM